MSRTQLQVAMRAVTQQEQVEAAQVVEMLDAAADDAEARQVVSAAAERLLAQAEEAAQAEAAAEAAAKAAEAEAKRAVDDARRKVAERDADAMTAVMREKKRFGLRMDALAPHEAQAFEIIRQALRTISKSPVPAEEDSFGAISSQEDIAKGAAVVAAITGAQA